MAALRNDAAYRRICSENEAVDASSPVCENGTTDGAISDGNRYVAAICNFTACEGSEELAADKAAILVECLSKIVGFGIVVTPKTLGRRVQITVHGTARSDLNIGRTGRIDRSAAGNPTAIDNQRAVALRLPVRLFIEIFAIERAEIAVRIERRSLAIAEGRCEFAACRIAVKIAEDRTGDDCGTVAVSGLEYRPVARAAERGELNGAIGSRIDTGHIAAARHVRLIALQLASGGGAAIGPRHGHRRGDDRFEKRRVRRATARECPADNGTFVRDIRAARARDIDRTCNKSAFRIREAGVPAEIRAGIGAGILADRRYHAGSCIGFGREASGIGTLTGKRAGKGADISVDAPGI